MKNSLLNSDEAAEYLGISRSYLHKLMMTKSISYYKPNGKLCYFDREDLDKWLRRNRIDSQDEIEQAALNYMVRRDVLH
jgi:excisionase family DNA binding protein